VGVDSNDLYDEFPDHYSCGAGSIWDTGISTKEPKTMKTTLSPRQLAQKALDFFIKRKPAVNSFKGGRWTHVDLYGITVIETPCRSFYVAYHAESVRLFRSVAKRSTRITPSDLRTIVDPVRPWLLELLKTKVPGGADLLAFERGDASVMQRRSDEARKRKESARLAQQAEAAAAKERDVKPTNPPIESPKRKVQQMALLDVETTTKKIVLETKTRSVVINRNQFLGLLRSAGADVPKKASMLLVYSDDSQDEIFHQDSGEKIRIEWEETSESEVSS